MLLRLDQGTRSSVAHIEVVRLDRRDKVFVGRLDGLTGIALRIQTLVHGDKAVVVALSELHRSDLGLDFSIALLSSGAPLVALTSDSIVRSGILLVLREARPDFEVCHLVLQLAISLLLPSTGPVGTAHLLES